MLLYTASAHTRETEVKRTGVRFIRYNFPHS